MNQVLLKKVKDLMSDVESHVEGKGEIIKYIMLAILTRKNLFLLGKPGNAKSLVIDLIRERITGSKQFKTLMTKYKDPDELFGRIDLNSMIPGCVSEEVLKKYPDLVEMRETILKARKNFIELFTERIKDIENAQKSDFEDYWYNLSIELMQKYDAMIKTIAITEGNRPVMITTGKIPDSDFVYTDETFKANDGVLNSKLTAMNEREYTNEGITVQLRVNSFFGSSNEIPDFGNPDDAILRPYYDRFDIRVVSTYLDNKHDALNAFKKARNKGVKPQATITMDELREIQSEISAIPVPESIDELMFEIAIALKSTGIEVSDRRMLNYDPIVRANAWLNGRDIIIPEDMLVLKNYLWEKPSDIETVVQVLKKLALDPINEKVKTIIDMAKDSYDQTIKDGSTKTDMVGKSKLIHKFRKEFIMAYDQLQDLSAKATTDNEKAILKKAEDELEVMSKQVHDTLMLTYAPLYELKLLMN